MTKTTITPCPAAHDYLRVSLDKSGRERSISEQQADNTRAREANGWLKGHSYIELPGSASRFARKTREEFTRLMTDLEKGQVFTPGDILILWESSRGSRQVSEWARLLELCESRRVSIYVTSHDRLYDLKNYRDRRTLQEDAVDGEYESAKTAQRVARAMGANAKRGMPHGKVLYGYERHYNERTREFVEQVPKPDEAAIVMGIIHDVARGVSLRAITADLNRRKVPTTMGATWNSTQVKLTATNIAYIGKRIHDPSKGTDPDSVNVYDACWPPISDDPTLTDRDRAARNDEFVAAFHRVQKKLTDPRRKTGRPGKVRHLLSMIATCAECDTGVMTVSNRFYRETGGVYGCRNGCTYVSKKLLDEWVEIEVLAYLARPEVWGRLTAGEVDDAELIAARGQLARLEADLQDAYVRAASWPAAGSLSAGALAAIEPAKIAGITEARKRIDDLSVPNALQGLLDGPGDLASRWVLAPLTTRREVIKTVCEVRVSKSPKRACTVPMDQRVELRWR